MECSEILKLSSSQKVAILGDFNFDINDPSLAQTRLLKEFCGDFNLKIMNSSATRITKTHQSVIDLLLTNVGFCFGQLSSSIFSSSDHNVIHTCFHARAARNVRSTCYVRTRNYRKLTEEVYEKSLECSYIWNDLLKIDDVDCAVDCFGMILRDMIDMIARKSGIGYDNLFLLGVLLPRFVTGDRFVIVLIVKPFV